MKTVKIWLLILAATLATAPLRARRDQRARNAQPSPIPVGWPRRRRPVAAPAAEKAIRRRRPFSGVVPATAPRNRSSIEKAEQQIKEQEKQRVLGVLPTFNVSYRSDAVSLTAWQKMSLAFHTTIDPVTFGTAFVVAGYHEAPQRPFRLLVGTQGLCRTNRGGLSGHL